MTGFFQCILNYCDRANISPRITTVSQNLDFGIGDKLYKKFCNSIVSIVWDPYLISFDVQSLTNLEKLDIVFNDQYDKTEISLSLPNLKRLSIGFHEETIELPKIINSSLETLDIYSRNIHFDYLYPWKHSLKELIYRSSNDIPVETYRLIIGELKSLQTLVIPFLRETSLNETIELLSSVHNSLSTIELSNPLAQLKLNKSAELVDYLNKSKTIKSFTIYAIFLCTNGLKIINQTLESLIVQTKGRAILDLHQLWVCKSSLTTLQIEMANHDNIESIFHYHIGSLKKVTFNRGTTKHLLVIKRMILENIPTLNTLGLFSYDEDSIKKLVNPLSSNRYISNLNLSTLTGKILIEILQNCVNIVNIYIEYLFSFDLKKFSKITSVSVKHLHSLVSLNTWNSTSYSKEKTHDYLIQTFKNNINLHTLKFSNYNIYSSPQLDKILLSISPNFLECN
ncbi:hypothetical protein DLAC_00719 [Tieghemostelium lacteum]|uniref:Uncharacterized protein n=1 Tax=Tieghemostelium lacteum TaxID=361077 RepID=A0A152A6R6_TIELA|nr:hypothetical protein DLAC_00719 [Tieghemostelium lacteum]|eukprot:KYR01929.1 hypothetical protein DLAC_00719 [Tieghemostelium lacteum]